MTFNYIIFKTPLLTYGKGNRFSITKVIWQILLTEKSTVSSEDNMIHKHNLWGEAEF
jgi:hypothetical protein